MSWSTWRSRLPGLAACLGIAVVAYLLGQLVPLVGGAVFAILMGILIASWRAPSATFKPGIAFSGKKILQGSIVVLGGSLSLGQIWQTGQDSLIVMLITLSSALLAAYILGKVLRVPSHLASLVGVGTGICGGSAIAAVAPIIRASDDEIAFSISTVFLFNVMAVVIFPPLGHLLGMSDTGFGLWAGTAINDTSSVVAAAYSFSVPAGDYATITKLARTTMIIPISLAFALYVARKREGGAYSLAAIFPWFIVLFLVASIANTLGLFGTELPGYLGAAGRFLIIVALAGVGLGTNLRTLVKTGPRPIFLGLSVWAVVALTSVAAQIVGGKW